MTTTGSSGMRGRAVGRRGGPRAGRSRPAPSARPTLRLERELLREQRTVVAGMDEVGRGALAGPVTVAVVTVGAGTRSAPAGLRDSKLLSAAARDRLAPRVRRWALGYGIGHASAVEIDRIGIIAALRLAGRRALAELSTRPDLVVLDGKHDWLSDPRNPAGTMSLFDEEQTEFPGCPPVRTVVKADLRCSSVAAASVLAKTTRDAIMAGYAAEHPGYGWADNKGYAAPGHLRALRERGPTVLHRTSWQLPPLHCPADTLPGLDVPWTQETAGPRERHPDREEQ